MIRPICRRGVVWITKLCNIKCRFCYYLYEKNKKHTPIDSINRTLRWFKDQYHIEYVDITGGEPTIHPYIERIVRFSNECGIKPTIITNAQRTDVIEKLIDIGLEDVLISIHGINDYYDKVVQKKGAFKNIEKTIEMLKKKNFTFRTNTTLTKYSCEGIDEIIDWLLNVKPRIVNLIAFNPHEGTLWAQKKVQDFQVSYTEMAKAAKKAIDKLLKEGIWTNVRYLPLCFMKGYETYVCNFHQWQFDPYEWDCISGERFSRKEIEQLIKEANSRKVFGYSNDEKLRLYLMKKQTSVNAFVAVCKECANKDICDGIYPQYLKSFGQKEFNPKKGKKIQDPLYYRIKDTGWAILKKKVSDPEI